MKSKQAGLVSLTALAMGLMTPVAAQADENGEYNLPLKAGYDDGFFLADQEENYRLDISGQVQLRYYQNFRNDPDAGYESTGNYQHRRTRVVFSGHVADPRISFKIQPEVSRSSGDLVIAEAYVGYKVNDQLSLTAGRFKSPFFSEDLHSSSRQLAVERSLVDDIFSQSYSTGVRATVQPVEDLRLYGMVHNGFGTGPEDFSEDVYEEVAHIALTGRAEYRVMGDWGQYKHFAAYDGDPAGLFLGGSIHWENRRDDLGGRWGMTRDFFSWTADAKFYAQNLSLYGAVVGRHALRTSMGAEEYDDFGFVGQAGYTFNDKVQPFVRFEHIKPDDNRFGAEADDVSLVTAGANWFLRGHDVKFTSDVVYALDPLDGFAGGSGGLGLLDDAPEEDGQFVWRTQFQLLF